uniref:(northern house mosquito) hypothetical protein n=1 Tax=Culex pipiens TaxID=7175 RepID=A0A8D8ATF0_CULPI
MLDGSQRLDEAVQALPPNRQRNVLHHATFARTEPELVRHEEVHPEEPLHEPLVGRDSQHGRNGARFLLDLVNQLVVQVGDRRVAEARELQQQLDVLRDGTDQLLDLQPKVVLDCFHCFSRFQLV